MSTQYQQKFLHCKIFFRIERIYLNFRIPSIPGKLTLWTGRLSGSGMLYSKSLVGCKHLIADWGSGEGFAGGEEMGFRLADWSERRWKIGDGDDSL
jgi:hypothetical protein